jgi:hypothetical protein
MLTVASCSTSLGLSLGIATLTMVFVPGCVEGRRGNGPTRKRIGTPEPSENLERLLRRPVAESGGEVIAGIFSGLEAENVAVGVVAAHAQHSEIALGTVFGGGSFIVCVALGLGAVLFPLRGRRQSHRHLLYFVLFNLGLIARLPPRWPCPRT